MLTLSYHLDLHEDLGQQIDDSAHMATNDVKLYKLNLPHLLEQAFTFHEIVGCIHNERSQRHPLSPFSEWLGKIYYIDFIQNNLHVI